MDDTLFSPEGLPTADDRVEVAASNTRVAVMSAASPADRERTSVFTSLVQADSDIAGLVAYSIYKQNKLDWLQAFEVAKGRVPNDAEQASYIIGESTPRRLATYRHLAETTLAGMGPNMELASPAIAGRERARGMSAQRPTPTIIGLCALIAVLAVIVIWLMTRSMLSGH